MDWDLIATVIITAITVLGSSEAFKFYKSRLTLKSKSKKYQMDLREEYKEDLKKRVNRLEEFLSDSAEEKDDLRQKVIALTAEVATLRERVKFLEAENERLKKYKMNLTKLYQGGTTFDDSSSFVNPFNLKKKEKMGDQVSVMKMGGSCGPNGVLMVQSKKRK